MFQVTWPCPYKLWWKTSKIFFFGTKRPMTLKLGIQHRVLEYYQYFIWWPFVDLCLLWQGQICFGMLLQGWKLIQHWVLMYFQVCSNSTYPQHSGERYRTNGPLVRYLIRFEPEQGVTVSFLYWLFDYSLFYSLIFSCQFFEFLHVRGAGHSMYYGLILDRPLG